MFLWLPAGSFDRFLNLQISLVIFMQIAMALFCAIANYIWQKSEGKKHYYLALNYNVQVGYYCLQRITMAAPATVFRPAAVLRSPGQPPPASDCSLGQSPACLSHSMPQPAGAPTIAL